MNKKKIIIIVPAIVLLITFVIAFSYAYWKLTYQATSVNKIVSSCFSMELANEKNSITLDSAYPISDEKGKTLTPYSFTITNTCDLFVSYTINLEMLEGTTLDSKYIKSMINSEEIINLSNLETTDISIDGATEARILFKGSLGSGDSTDYTLRIWMDSDTPPTEDTMNKIFQAKITVTAEVSTYSPVENGFTNLAEALLVNEYQTTSLSVAKNKIASKQEIDFSKTAPYMTWNEKEGTVLNTKKYRRADPSLIGSYGIAEKTTKFFLGTDYTFDSETGYYTLTNTDYYDVNVLDFENQNYYFCESELSATSYNTVTANEYSTCLYMYKILGVNSIEDVEMELSSGSLINVKSYSVEFIQFYQTELESDKSDKGLYLANDDYGDTYYYRGSVTNNNLVFAGYNWRVIRINGDGSIRLLFNDDNFSNQLIVGSSKFNEIYDNPTYVGYMYSNTLNTSYEDTISNDNDSTMKTYLDNWYKTNIVDTGYSSYIEDSGFCNDRSVSPTSGGTGYEVNNTTFYAAVYRAQTYSPSYYCSNISNDLFTLSNSTIGNQKLTYPVGLITLDELLYGGNVKDKINTKSYLYTGNIYATMTPNHFSLNHKSSFVYRMLNTGTIGSTGVANLIGARPVINLKADTEITGGIGTKNDPFIVK